MINTITEQVTALVDDVGAAIAEARTVWARKHPETVNYIAVGFGLVDQKTLAKLAIIGVTVEELSSLRGRVAVGYRTVDTTE